MWRLREIRQSVVATDILAPWPTRQPAAAAVVMQLLGTAFLVAEDTEIFVAAVEPVVAASMGPNTVSVVDAVWHQQSIVRSKEGTWYPSHRNDP